MTAHRKIFLGLAASALVLFGTAVTFPFVWDDEAVVLTNPAVQSRNPLRVFSGSYFPKEPGWDQQYIRYRPLASLSFWLDHRLWGNRPGGFHATGVFLHGVVACLLYGLAWGLTSNLWASGLAAFFFLIHPAQPQAVTFIASRGDLVAAVFVLLFFWAHRRFLRREDASMIPVIPVWTVYLAAILSKEVTFILPAVLLGHDRLYFSERTRKQHHRRLWIERVGLGVVFLAYLGLRSLISPLGNMQWVSTIRGGSWVLGQSVSSHLVWLAAPLERRFPEMFVGQDPWGWGVLAAAAAGATFLVCWKRMARGGLGAVAAFGVWWGGLALVPVSNVPLVAAPPFAPNYLYLPLIGFSVALGAVFAWGISRKENMARWVFFSGAFALAIFWIPQTYAIHRYWGDPLQIAKQNIDSGIPVKTGYCHDLVAQDELQKGHFESALKLAQTAVRIEPGQADYHVNLGLALQSLSRTQEAQAEYERAIQIDSKSARAYSNLSSIFLIRSENSRAVELARRAVALEPGLAQAHANLAESYWRMGRRLEAMEQWEMASGFAGRDDLDVKMSYAQRLTEYGQQDQAVAVYRNIVRHHPLHQKAYLGLAVALAQKQAWEEALQAHRKALELAPADTDSSVAYGVTLARMKRYAEAIVVWQKALALDPTREDLKQYLQRAAELKQRQS
ncbi:MAG: tetratricopeptide repeat protein [Candidatus Omnitrophica bacterium]|nr:tetratricopeptide repeat protein [Candidatus Omnitrophota bacterium]